MKFLLVEDQELLRVRMGRALEARGFEVILAANVDEALAAASKSPTHAVIDLRLGEEFGLEVLRELKLLLPDLKAVILSGYGSIATAVEAVRLGAVNVLQKPADIDMVLAAFEKADRPPLAESPSYEPPSLARAEWEHIQRVLADSGGNISEAARRLGIHRRTLQRKLQKFPPKT